MVLRKFKWDILVLGLLVVVAAELYAQSIGFAFINDDPSGSLAWVESHSLIQILLTSFNQFNYRPLGYILWRLIWLAVGAWAPAYHLLSLSCHLLNVILLWFVSLRLTGKRVYAFSVCLIFSFFPFNYEAVAYITALFHVLTLLFSLLAIILYDVGRTSNRRIYLVGAGVALVAALLSHPNAMVVPLLLGIWEFTRRPVTSWRDLLVKPLWLYIIILALYLVLRLLIPQIEVGAVPVIHNPIGNIPPFIQSLVYPILPFTNVTKHIIVYLALMLVVIIIITYWCAIITNTRRLWYLAFCWIILAALPSLFLLDYQYIVGSPRLFYFSSAAVAMLWALPVLALAPMGSHSSWVPVLLRCLQVILIGDLIFSPLPYVISQITYMSRASDFTFTLAKSASISPTANELVYVNLPFYFTNCAGCNLFYKNNYPYAPIGAVIIPSYASLRDFLRFNGGPDRPARAIVWRGVEMDWAPFGEETSAVVLRQAVEKGQVFLAQMDSGSLINVTELWQQARATGTNTGTLSNTIALLESPPELARASELAEAKPVGWIFGTSLELLAYQLEPSSVLPGGQLNLNLFWRSLPTANVDVTSRLMVKDRFGNNIIDRGFEPVPGFPLAQWDINTTYVTRLQVTIPSNASLGPANLILEVDSVVPQAPLQAFDTNGANFGTTPYLGGLLLGQSSTVAENDITPKYTASAVFGDQIALLGYTSADVNLRSGDELTVTLYWQALAPPGVNYTVFIHVLDAEGHIVAQQDGEPNNGQYPTSVWKTGDLVKDVHQVAVGALPAGSYSLEVGLYQWPSLVRLQVSVDGNHQGDAYLLFPFQVVN